MPSTSYIGTRVLKYHVLVSFHNALLVRIRLCHGDGSLQFFLGDRSTRILIVVAQALVLYGVTSGKNRHTSQHAYQYILSFHTHSLSLSGCSFNVQGKERHKAFHASGAAASPSLAVIMKIQLLTHYMLFQSENWAEASQPGFCSSTPLEISISSCGIGQ